MRPLGRGRLAPAALAVAVALSLGATGCGVAAASAATAAASGGTAAAAGRTAAPRVAKPGAPAGARNTASALALALPVLFRGTPDLVVRNTHSLSYVVTTAGLAARAVGARWTGTAPSTAAWLVVGTAVVGPPCRCNPPRPETVWAIVARGRAAVDSGATTDAHGLRRLGRWTRVPSGLAASLA